MTRREYDRRVAALKLRYPYLFAGPRLGDGIEPGWLAIVEELCGRIDGALASAERPGIHFRRITKKSGGLRADLSIAPPRLDLIAIDGRGLSGHPGTARERSPGSSIFERIEPFVRAAEAESRATCSFCGAPGELRRNRRSLLTLCDRHAPFDHHDLEVVFEILTDRNRYLVPPSFSDAVAYLRLGAIELRDPQLVRLGVLPPETPMGPYRLFVGFGGAAKWPERDVTHAAGRLIGWPTKSVTFDAAVAADDAVWIIGEPP